MADYQVNPLGGVIRLADGLFIPEDGRNRDWQAYQAWVAAGHTAGSAPTPPNPATISPLDFFARFTPEEIDVVNTAALISPSTPQSRALFHWIMQASAAQFIDLNDARTRAGMEALVAIGLITGARKTEILTP